MLDSHAFSHRRGTPPQTPLNSGAFGHPSWGPTTVPPAPKIPFRARRPFTAEAVSSSSSASHTQSSSALARATSLSSRMAMALQASDEAEASAIYGMQLDDDSHQAGTDPFTATTTVSHGLHHHSAAFIAHSNSRRDSSSSGFGSLRSHDSTSDFFNPAISSSSSRTTLVESPVIAGSSHPANKAQQQHDLTSGAYMRSAGDSHSSPPLPSLQPAFTPMPSRRSFNRERARAHSPNEPLDSDEEDRLCLRFNPAMLHRCPDLHFVPQTASFGLSQHAPAPPTPPQHQHDHVLPPPVHQQSQMIANSMNTARATTPESSPIMVQESAGTTLEPVVPESPALRTRSRTRIAAAVAAAVAASASSAANPRHSRSGSSNSIANVPVRMSSLSTVSSLQQKSQSQTTTPRGSSPADMPIDETVSPTGEIESKQRKSGNRTQLSVRTRRQAQRDREEQEQRAHPQRTPSSSSRPKAPPAGATLACPPPATTNPASTPTILSPASMRRKRNGGRMRAFDVTPTPSPPPSNNRATLHGGPYGGARRSKSPSPFYSHPSSALGLAAAAAAANAGMMMGTESTDSHSSNMEQQECLNPMFPLPLSGGRNGHNHNHTHPRSQRPRRLSSRCPSVRSSTPGMSPIPMPMTPTTLSVALPCAPAMTADAMMEDVMHGTHQLLDLDRDVAMEH